LALSPADLDVLAERIRVAPVPGQGIVAFSTRALNL
jgi:hypothetical protein